jgi:hypothetical protein
MTWTTFGIWRRKRPEEIDHQFRLIDGFECSTEEFYQAIQDDLAQREVPGLQITRESFVEGGLLSARREYLRMRRERLVFDVCSAPFGKAWFFSYRFAEIHATVMVWELLLVLAALAGIVYGYVVLFGALWGGVIIGLTLLGIGLLLRNSLALGLYGLDDMLLRLPVFGVVYEELLRRPSYHRDDTRLMYVTLVRNIIEARVQEFAAAKGFTQTPFVNATPDIHHMLAQLLKQPRMPE